MTWRVWGSVFEIPLFREMGNGLMNERNDIYAERDGRDGALFFFSPFETFTYFIVCFFLSFFFSAPSAVARYPVSLSKVTFLTFLAQCRSEKRERGSIPIQKPYSTSHFLWAACCDIAGGVPDDAWIWESNVESNGCIAQVAV
jgi:hypothetical protein